MKRPKPRKRGNNWSISIMLHGKREYCTRDTEQECLNWAMNKLIDASSTPKEQIEEKKKTITTFHDLFNMYYKSHGRDTKSKKYIREQLDSFARRFSGLAEKDITKITAQDLTHWRNKRQSEVSDGTVLKEISLYSAVFTYAQKELFLLDTNPFFGLKKPKKPKSRNRRILQSEIEKIIAELKYEIGQVPKISSQFVAWAFLFALETAMRRGEILSIRKRHIFSDHIHLHLYSVPACVGCGLHAATPFFPEAAKENQKSFGTKYSGVTPPVHIVRANKQTVYYQYQLKGQYKTNGVAKFRPNEDNIYDGIRVDISPDRIEYARMMLNFFSLTHK